MLEACGVQIQLVDNETAVVAGAGDFVAGIGTTLTITYLRP